MMVFRMSASQIQDDAKSGKIKIAIIGLGQVGLPQALHFIKEGVFVIGVDVDEKRIEQIKHGLCPVGTRELAEIFRHFNKSNNFEVTTDTVSAVGRAAGGRSHP